MRTFAAGCLSTPLTSQMVGWTWTCSENESSCLLWHTVVLLAAPHLSVTLCLSYICAASVSRLGSSPAKMTQNLGCLTALICFHMSSIQSSDTRLSHTSHTIHSHCKRIQLVVLSTHQVTLLPNMKELLCLKSNKCTSYSVLSIFFFNVN